VNTNDIFRLEEQRCQAIIDRDMDTLESLISNDLLYIHSTGIKDSKESYLRGVASGDSRFLSIATSDVDIRFLTESVAVVTGRAKMDIEHQGQRIVHQNRYANIWIMEQGGPKMVIWQTGGYPAGMTIPDFP
jgi:hypothetical protein